MKEVKLSFYKQKAEKGVYVKIKPLNVSNGELGSVKIKVNSIDMDLLTMAQVGDNVGMYLKNPMYFKYSELIEKEYEYLMVLEELPEMPRIVNFLISEDI